MHQLPPTVTHVRTHSSTIRESWLGLANLLYARTYSGGKEHENSHTHAQWRLFIFWHDTPIPKHPYMILQYTRRSLLQNWVVDFKKSPHFSSSGWKVPPGFQHQAINDASSVERIQVHLPNSNIPIDLCFKQRFTVTPGSTVSSNSDMTGTWIWPTAQRMAARLENDLETLEKGKPLRILELGSGCGLLGMTLAAIGHEVLLTDHAGNVTWLRENADLNRSILGNRVSTAQLGWGDEKEMSDVLEKRQTFDLIVGSDVIYDPNSHEVLVETLRRFATPANAPVFLGYPKRDEAREHQFFEMAGEYFDIQATLLDTDESNLMYAVCRVRQ